MDRKIEIQGTEYPIKFGFGAYKILGAEWKKGFQGVITRIQEDFASVGDDPSFEQFETIGQLARAAMLNAKVENPPQVDEIMDVIMYAPEKIETIMQAFAEKIPQQSGNPQPAPKGRKKAAKKKKSS